MGISINTTSGLGKKAEAKIKEWLDRPDRGWDFNRIPDQLTGMYGSRNISDFDLFIYPEKYYIESKCTTNDRFDFSLITETQYNGLLKKADLPHVHGVVIVLFAEYQRAFAISIQEIDRLKSEGKASLNIKKIDKWGITYQEIETVPNARKQLLDYTGELKPDLL